MTAAARLAALDSLPADELCQMAEIALAALVNVMNEETTLLRAGHLRQASILTPDKARLAQDYVGFARSVQRQSDRLKTQAPQAVERLRRGHDRLATQMAENLRVLATARLVTEDLLTDVAKTVGQANKAKAYGRSGAMVSDPAASARGLAVNRAL
nr:flagellar protein FlgN [uncultured Devosia sp.]